MGVCTEEPRGEAKGVGPGAGWEGFLGKMTEEQPLSSQSRGTSGYCSLSRQSHIGKHRGYTESMACEGL